jgi:outer membrane protein W
MRSFSSIRILFLLAMGVAVPAFASGQLTTGQKFLGAHVGLSAVGSAPSVGVSGEVAYNDRIAIGAFADTWSYGEEYRSSIGTTRWDVRYIAVAGTGAYHFPVESNPKLDPFLGIGLGYYIVSSETTSQGVSFSGDSSRVFLGGFGGLRYHFKETVSGVARLGFGSSYLTLGVDWGL